MVDHLSNIIDVVRSLSGTKNEIDDSPKEIEMKSLATIGTRFR